MSILVIGKAQQFEGSMLDLLTQEAADNPLKWGPVWQHCQGNVENLEDARALIVSLVLLVVAAWDFRISDILTGFPLLLLWFVERPAGEACEHRRQIAAKLLDTPECCLKAIPTSDIQWKLRIIFPSELQAVRDTGKVPSNLFTFMLVWRSQVPVDT